MGFETQVGYARVVSSSFKAFSCILSFLVMENENTERAPGNG
jgi:hypothetical protein